MRLVDVGRTRWANLGGVGAPLLVGATIYLLWRPDSLLAFRWATALGLSGQVQSLRSFCAALPSPSDVAVYSLPGGLWLFALVLTLGSVWLQQPGLSASIWLAVPITVAVGSEIGQLQGWVLGTFDPLDLLVYSLSYACGLVCLALMERKVLG